MTDLPYIKGVLRFTLVLFALSWLVACQEDIQPPVLRNLDRPEDVAFLCARQSGDGDIEVRELDGCQAETEWDLLGFITQSARSEVIIVRLPDYRGADATTLDIDRRIPLTSGIAVGSIPSAVVAVDGGAAVYVANRGSSFLSVVPVEAAYREIPPVTETIELPAPAHYLAVSSDRRSLYASLPLTGQIAVIDLTSDDPEVVRTIDLGWTNAPTDGDADGDSDADADGDMGPDGDADGDMGPDGDADADGDMFADGDADADGDMFADGDADADGDMAADGDADADGDMGPDGDADADGDLGPDGDADADMDSGPDGDADADADGDADADADADADGDADADADADTDETPALARPAEIVVFLEGEDERLFVAIENATFIIEFDPDLGEVVDRIDIGFTTRRLAVVPEAPEGRPARGGPWLYAVETVNGNVVVVNLSTRQLVDLSGDDPLRDNPGIDVPGVAQDVVVLERYPDICGAGGDDSDCVDGDDPWNATSLVGVFAFVTSTNGYVYVITVQDEYVPSSVGNEARCLVEGEEGVVYDPTALGCARHVPRPTTDYYEITPRITELPEQTFDGSDVLLDPLEAPTDFPWLEGYTIERSADVVSSDTNETESYQTYGVFFDWSHPERSKTEQWLLTYEGVIPGTSRRGGNVQAWAAPEIPNPCDTYAEFVDRAATYCSNGVCGYADCDGAADVLVILDGPSPLDPEATDCSVYEVGGDEALEYRIREAFNSTLVIEPIHDDGCIPLPTQECFPYAVSYEIRANNHWILEGYSTGFLHNRTSDGEGRCMDRDFVADCPEITCDMSETSASAEPFQRTGPEDLDPRCLLASRVREEEVFANPFFCLMIHPGLCGDRAVCESPDDVFPTVRDSWLRWNASGGFHELRVEVGDLPGTLRYNPGDDSLYAIDRSDMGLIEVSLLSLRVLRSYL